MRKLFCLAFALAALPIMPALGADPGNDETIIVHGMTPQAVRREIDKLASAPWNHQLARWGANFCPTVVGLPDPYQTVVMEHVERAARAVISDATAKCARPNVFILFNEDGTAAFDQILDRAPMLGNTSPLVAIDTSDFQPPGDDDITDLKVDRPVRWYRSTVTDPAPGVVAVWDPRFHRFVATNNVKISQQEKDTVAHVSSLMVIVDTQRATGARLGQLADYIAFVILAGPKLGEDFSSVSIMSLFDGSRFNPAAPEGLTPFDHAMLGALYDADPAREAHDEQAEIASRVRSTLAHH